MAIPLIRTKLYIPPPRPNLVPRGHLVRRLDEGLALGRRLTLVSAPAGFGKTTLLSTWLQQGQAAWVSLDEGDNDPARFWSYAIGALQTLWPDLGGSALAALHAPQPPSLETVLTVLINEMTTLPELPSAGPSQASSKLRPARGDASPGSRFVLVLDDYHLIQARPVHESLSFLLDHQPPRMHLAIATRADPPLPLARLRGRGQVTELRVDDLRFTAGEASTFLRQVAGIDLPAGDLAALESRTEGWITGLQLAALSMQGHEDRSAFIAAFAGSNRYVLDYLTEEVLQRQPPEAQAFLLETAILSRLSGPLCDAVTGQHDGQVMLEMMEGANLFLVALDDQRHWYRYHRLFADLLRARLEDTQAERLPELHRRASDWYEAQGLLDEALDHALAAGDLARVARAIEVHGMPKLMRGELTGLLRWIEALPEAMIQASPRICVSHAWVLLLLGQVAGIEPRLQQAEQRLAEMPREHLAGDIATIRAYVAAQQGDVQHTVELAHEALEHLPPASLGERAIVFFVLGGAHLLQGDVKAAAGALREAGTLGQEGGNIHVAAPALNALAGLEMLQGRLYQAQAIAQEAVRLASGPGGQPLPFASGALSALAELAYEWNDLEGALAYAQQSVDLSRQWGNSDSLCSATVTLARILTARGELDAARQGLLEVERLSRSLSTTPLLPEQLAAAWVRLWLALGSTAALARWVEEAALVSQHLPFAEGALALARARLALGRSGVALEGLEPLLAEARGQGLTAVAIEALALQALAHQAQDAQNQALADLADALALAEPEGFVRRLVDEGEPMKRLLSALLAGRGPLPLSVSKDYVKTLLVAFPGPTGESEGPGPATHPALVEPLSERELEVLQLVAAGLSNREIAGELVIAISTVKSHTNSIFGKLGVRSRTQAIARAQELGIL